MNKKIKKLLILAITVCILFTSVLLPYEKTKAVSLEVGLIVLGVAFIGSACFACDYLSNPDKYSDLTESMKDFKNSTVENQKKLYEIEKANFEMVMQKAVDSNVGTCLIGSNGTLYSARQLQSQEYPSFDIWKGYKEKESEKPKPSLWQMFELGSGLADLICAIWPDGNGSVPADSAPLQRWFTGDDGYIDRETGQLFGKFMCSRMQFDYYGAVSEDNNYVNCLNEFTWTQKFDNADTARVAMYVDYICAPASFYLYDADYGFSRSKQLYREIQLYTIVGSAGSSNYIKYVKSANGVLRYYHSTMHQLTEQSFDIGSDAPMSFMPTLVYTVYLNYDTDERMSLLKDWHFLSTNLPVFDTREHALSYFESGSLDGLLNGAPESGPTPTDSPVSDSHIGPVRQYTNYFRNTFSPSMMANYVNYNIVNNWDGDTTTFNINNYTGKESDDSEVTATPTPDLRKPTFTPIPPDPDGGDTTNNYDINITNNLLIEQTNIIQNISETVNNIYNFFQIDVDVIVEDLTPDTDSKFLPLYDMITDVNKLIPEDEFEQMEGAVDPIISTLYPKITIKVPIVLDDFLSISDKKIMEEDGDKVIILCDYYDFRKYFARFRKFLQVVIYIGMFFYLMKEFSVIWSIQ